MLSPKRMVLFFQYLCGRVQKTKEFMMKTKGLLLGVVCILLIFSCEKEKLDIVDDVCTIMDDIVFMDYCYKNFDVNNDGKVSMTEASAVKEINITNTKTTSLKGLEYFTQLTRLYCYGNQLSSLDVSNNTQLSFIDCRGNRLTYLDISKTSISFLDLSRNYDAIVLNYHNFFVFLYEQYNPIQIVLNQNQFDETCRVMGNKLDKELEFAKIE